MTPLSMLFRVLISIIDVILKNIDNPKQPKAVINLLADWSKAFNKVNHNIIKRIIIAMKVPHWLLKITLSYLQNRTSTKFVHSRVS